MSKDIRSYFSKPSGISQAKPESPQNKKRRKRVIESDEETDDDLIIVKKKPKEQSTTASQKQSQKKRKETIVQVENFFGSKPVQQIKRTLSAKKSEEKVTSSTPQKKNSKKKDSASQKHVTELTFENDDELEASLLLTDEEQLISSELNKSLKNGVKKETNKSPKKSPKKEETKVVPKKEEKEKRTPKKEEEKKKTPKKEISVEVKINKTPKNKEDKTDEGFLNSEQKRRNAEAYQKYLNRSGPKNPGSKAIPKGTPSCLQGLTFVITGVLDSLEREEATELIQKCGGRVTGSVSKKTNFIVVGEEPGASKIQKAETFGTKKINEDELLELIREKSEGDKDNFVQGTPEKTSKYLENGGSGKKRVLKMDEVKDETGTSKKPKPEENKTQTKAANSLKHSEKGRQRQRTTKSGGQLKKVQKPVNTYALKLVDELFRFLLFPVLTSVKSQKEETAVNNVHAVEKPTLEKTTGDQLWVDKYRPKSTKHIVGQMGDKSNVKKLTKWLQNWHKNHSSGSGKKPARPAPWAQNDDGSYFKAALLSGPPGVGKTTSVHLVCRELGLDIVEFNASDTRSKRLLQEEVSELLSNKSIRGFFKGTGNNYEKHVLVMDEVDGMAGNEDRGGIQELIQLIKNTKVPIVGICNDRNHPKMRSLVNYCYDLRFQRPRLEQIKGAMKSICFKENFDISGEALEELIIASNHDIRQVLHNLSLLASGHKSLTLEEARRKGQQAKKPLNLGPWDVARKVFSASDHEKMSFTDKTDLFFQDYSLGPLFVQDTYLRVKPYKAKNSEIKKLELIAQTAESLALGDVVEKTIRSQNSWSLLPVQAIFSSVLPGHYMSGHVQGQIQFPVWLGKNSKSNKFDRLLQDLNSSLKINVTGTKGSVNLDYLHHLKNGIVKPLVDEGSQGVQTALQFMLSYHLTKEDLDSILELSAWPGSKDLFSKVDPKVKAALTRALNKEGQMIVSAKKSTKIKGGDDVEMEEGERGDEDADEEESENIDCDPMIKVGKVKNKKASEGSRKDEKKKGERRKAGDKKGEKMNIINNINK